VIRYKDRVQGHDREAVKYQMAAAQLQQQARQRH
jgi:putative sigma-54 modulation protein